MKDVFDFIKNYGAIPIIFGTGIFTIGLFILSLIPSVNFIPKLFVLFVLTH